MESIDKQAAELEEAGLANMMFASNPQRSAKAYLAARDAGQQFTAAAVLYDLIGRRVKAEMCRNYLNAVNEYLRNQTTHEAPHRIAEAVAEYRQLPADDNGEAEYLVDRLDLTAVELLEFIAGMR